MKKSTYHTSKKLKPIVVYLDDLAEIYECVASEIEKFTFKIDDWEIEGPEEILNWDKGAIKSVRVQSYSPWFELNLQGYTTEIKISEESNVANGLSNRVEGILKKHKRRIAGALANLYLPLALIAVQAALGFILKERLLLLFLLATILLTLASFWLCFHLRFNAYSKIIASNSKQRKSFIEKNSDSIVLVIISAVLGIGGTLVAQLIWDKLKGS